MGDSKNEHSIHCDNDGYLEPSGCNIEKFQKKVKEMYNPINRTYTDYTLKDEEIVYETINSDFNYSSVNNSLRNHLGKGQLIMFDINNRRFKFVLDIKNGNNQSDWLDSGHFFLTSGDTINRWQIYCNESDLSKLTLTRESTSNNFWESIVNASAVCCNTIRSYINDMLFHIKTLKKKHNKRMENLQYNLIDSLELENDIKIHEALVINARDNLEKILYYNKIFTAYVRYFNQKETLYLNAGVPAVYETLCLIWQPLNPQAESICRFLDGAKIKETVKFEKVSVDLFKFIPLMKIMIRLKIEKNNNNIDYHTKKNINLYLDDDKNMDILVD